MRIDVVGTNLQLTEAIRQHAAAKAEKLPKYFDGVQQITFRIAREDHQQRATYDVEMIIDVVKHEDLVCHARGPDLYAAIDQVVHKGVRLVTDFKDRLRQR